MGGKEAVVHLKKLLVDTPIFATSGYYDDPVISHPQKYGFSASLRKPFKIQELAHLLNKFLN
jgi:CheY-like chemotaxis protein